MHSLIPAESPRPEDEWVPLADAFPAWGHAGEVRRLVVAVRALAGVAAHPAGARPPNAGVRIAGRALCAMPRCPRRPAPQVFRFHELVDGELVEVEVRFCRHHTEQLTHGAYDHLALAGMLR